MKKPISTTMFILGIVVWAWIITFVISIPVVSFALAQYVPAEVAIPIDIFVSMVTFFIAAAIASKRYIVPALFGPIATWVAFIDFLVILLISFAVPSALRSQSIYGAFSIQMLVPIVARVVAEGIAVYASLRFFSSSN